VHWYASYRTGGYTVMHVFKGRELAIAAACEFLDRAPRDALEVGPMLGEREGELLDEHDLQRIRGGTAGSANRSGASPAPETSSSLQSPRSGRR